MTTNATANNDSGRAPIETVMLARLFSEYLRTELGDELMREVVRRNAAETSEGVCHSHDFCDANEVMLAAYEMVTGAKHEFDDPQSDSTTLWNAAWDLAHANAFYLNEEQAHA